MCHLQRYQKDTSLFFSYAVADLNYAERLVKYTTVLFDSFLFLLQRTQPLLFKIKASKPSQDKDKFVKYHVFMYIL